MVVSEKDLQYVYGEFWSEMTRSKMSEKNMSFIFFQINLLGDIPLSLVPKRDNTAGWNWFEDKNKYWLSSDKKLNKMDKWMILLITTLKYFKVWILLQSHFGKMKLWPVDHFYNIFVLTFGRDCYCIQQSRPKVRKNMLWKWSTGQSFIFPKWLCYKIHTLACWVLLASLEPYCFFR